MIDPAFGLNAFRTPKYLNESETTARNIITILEGRPGFFPSIPELGMNIKSTLLYKSLDDIEPDVIKYELTRQCNQFISNIRDGTFDVVKAVHKGKPMLVFIVPVTIEQAPKQIAIGTTMNDKGEVIYKIEYINESITM